MADPWLSNKATDENVANNFEDSFIDCPKLPDSEQYLSRLESKLAKLKKSSQVESKDVIQSLSAAKDSYLARLMNGEAQLSVTDAELDEPLSALRRLSLDRQAHTLGETVELLKYDQLAKELDNGEA